MKGAIISILWLLPMISLLISIAAGLFLVVSLRLHRTSKLRVVTKAMKTKEFSR
jgi:hypothetical protein